MSLVPTTQICIRCHKTIKFGIQGTGTGIQFPGIGNQPADIDLHAKCFSLRRITSEKYERCGIVRYQLLRRPDLLIASLVIKHSGIEQQATVEPIGMNARFEAPEFFLVKFAAIIGHQSQIETARPS